MLPNQAFRFYIPPWPSYSLRGHEYPVFFYLRPNRGQTSNFADICVRLMDTDAHSADTDVRAADTSHAISCTHPQYLIDASTAELVYPQGLSRSEKGTKLNSGKSAITTYLSTFGQ